MIKINKTLLTTLLMVTLPFQSLYAFFTSTKIKSDEHVLFFPAIAYLDETNKEWVVDIHGWIFENNIAVSIKSAAAKFLGLAKNPEHAEFDKLMKQRMHWFFVDNERNKKLSILIQGQKYTLNKSKPNGHFYGEIRLKKTDVDQWSLDYYNRISFQAVTRKNDSRTFKGYIQFIPKHGLSIISDVDDTIKLSEVHDKNLLLKNTFFRQYEAIPGMTTSYNRWRNRSRKNGEIVFHYVTASPWQLYVPLSRFLKEHEFPYGSFHMRHFRIKDKTAFNMFKSSVDYKTEEITRLMEKFPHRRFVLVGDSGENDFEVYTKIAKQYPKRIRAIYIHEVKPKPIEKTRYQSATKKVKCPVIVFKTYDTPANLEFH